MAEEGESLREHRMKINVIGKTLRDLYYNPETGYQNTEKRFKDIQRCSKLVRSSTSIYSA